MMKNQCTRKSTGVYRRGGQAALRTIRLVIISLAAVGIAFALYQLNVGPIEGTKQVAELPEEHRDFLGSSSNDNDLEESGILINNVRVSSRERSGIVILDQTLRKKMHIKGRWNQSDESGKRFHLDSPTITYYMLSGQKAEIRADEGMITSRERDKMDPQKGVMKGNVRITLDQTTNEWRQQHPDQADQPTPLNRLVRIWMEEMEFDLDLGWLSSEQEVRIESEQMKLEGVGLAVRWNEDARGFEYLEILEGKNLIYKGGWQMGMDLGALNPEKDDTEEDSSAVPTMATDQDEKQQPDLEQEVAEVSETHRAADTPDVQHNDDAIIIDLAAIQEQNQPETDTFVADFESDVVARQMVGDASEGFLRAAHLKLLFDIMSGSATEGAEGEQEEKATPESASQQEQTDSPTDSSSHVVITWSGPLKVSAVEPADEQGSELRRQIVATGQPVELSNADGRYLCSKLIHHMETDFTEFYGSETSPAVLASGENSRIEANEVITLDKKKKTANLRGGVKIDHSDFKLQADIVDAYFGTPPPQSNQGSILDLLDVLDCRENVILRSGKDEIACQHLNVQMGLGVEGRNLPRHAHAVGHVVARQGERIMSAEKYMDMVFGELPRDAEGNILQNSPALKELKAEEEIRIIDRLRNWDIVGHKLTCEFDDQQVMIYGNIVGQTDHHAQVMMGNYYIEGATVTFDESRKWARVPGVGRTRFLVSEDLDGRELGQPVPIEITWSNEMELRGLENVMIFDGRAVATSENNVLRGDVLRITLTDDEPEIEEDVLLASAEPLGMWFLQPYSEEVKQLKRFAGNKPKQGNEYANRFAKRATDIVAEGNASLESVSSNYETDRLESRMTLRGGDIAFDLAGRVMIVEGAGVLLIEDYPCKDEVLGRQSSSSTGLFASAQSQGPSQTFIRWDRGMHYYYSKRSASFEGASEPVWLQHWSGSHILLSESLTSETQLTTERLKELQEAGLGRQSELTCNRLVVQFLRNEDDRSQGGGQMSVGQLDRFQADGKVLLTDNQWRIRGDHLVYVDESELFTLNGLPGEKAYISGLNPATGRGGEWTGSELHLEMKTGKVISPDGVGRSVGR